VGCSGRQPLGCDRGDHAVGRALQQVPDEGAADAEAHHHEPVDAQVIHDAELIVGEGIPRPIDLERAIGRSQVGGDAAILVLELVDRVERIVQAGNRRVQAAAGDQQQREAGAELLVVDADRSFFVKGHGGAAMRRLRNQHGWYCRHYRCGSAGLENPASGPIYHEVS
jgi:hypothetical protein